jgi:hypothetical protein
MPGLRQAILLAEKMGKELERSKILQRPLPQSWGDYHHFLTIFDPKRSKIGVIDPFKC